MPAQHPLQHSRRALPPPQPPRLPPRHLHFHVFHLSQHHARRASPIRPLNRRRRCRRQMCLQPRRPRRPCTPAAPRTLQPQRGAGQDKTTAPQRGFSSGSMPAVLPLDHHRCTGATLLRQRWPHLPPRQPPAHVALDPDARPRPPSPRRRRRRRAARFLHGPPGQNHTGEADNDANGLWQSWVSPRLRPCSDTGRPC